MKLKFLKNATDKYSGVAYKVGKEYEFEEKRAKEILAVKGFAEEVKEVVENVENVVESSNENTETIEKPKRKKTTKKTTTKKD